MQAIEAMEQVEATGGEDNTPSALAVPDGTNEADDSQGDAVRLPPGWDQHAKTPLEYLGENSPTKRSSTSGVWKDVKRLRGDHPENPTGCFTHICVARTADSEDGTPRFCNKLMKLHKNKPKNGQASWLTTKAVAHMKDEHPVESIAGAQAVQRVEKKNEESISIALDYGMPDVDGTDIDSVSKFKLSKRDRSLSAQVSPTHTCVCACACA